MELGDDGVMLDMFVCGSCKNQFWVESYEVDLYLNDPAGCPFCMVEFDEMTTLEEDDEER